MVLPDGDGEADIQLAADRDDGVGEEAAVGPHGELSCGPGLAHPLHRLTQEMGGAPSGVSPARAEMYHFFRFRPEEFWAYFHRRSNVESTFKMVKDKFGSSLFSKSTTGQVNEAICKVLCHNLDEVARAFRYGLNPALEGLSIAAI